MIFTIGPVRPPGFIGNVFDLVELDLDTLGISFGPSYHQYGRHVLRFNTDDKSAGHDFHEHSNSLITEVHVENHRPSGYWHVLADSLEHDVMLDRLVLVRQRLALRR